MSDNIGVESIIELVARHALCRPETLSLSTRIGEDLCIVGDDADELLIEFSREFNVDLSEMDFDAYFPREASSEMNYYLSVIAKNNSKNNIFKFLDILFRRIITKRVVYKSLTINDLAYAAKIGRWKAQIN